MHRAVAGGELEEIAATVEIGVVEISGDTSVFDGAEVPLAPILRWRVGRWNVDAVADMEHIARGKGAVVEHHVIDGAVEMLDLLAAGRGVIVIAADVEGQRDRAAVVQRDRQALRDTVHIPLVAGAVFDHGVVIPTADGHFGVLYFLEGCDVGGVGEGGFLRSEPNELVDLR